MRRNLSFFVIWHAWVVALGAFAFVQSILWLLESTSRNWSDPENGGVQLLLWLVLIPINVVLSNFKVHMPDRKEMLSVGDTVNTILAVQYGPAYAVVSAVVEGFVTSRRRGAPKYLRRASYNAATFSIGYIVATPLYTHISSLATWQVPSRVGWSILGILALVFVKYLINSFLVLVIVALAAKPSDRLTVLKQNRQAVLWTGGTELICFVGASVHLTLTSLGLGFWHATAGLLVIIGFCLAMLRYYFLQLSIEVQRSSLARERAALAESRAHVTLQTVRALAAAIEAKHPSTVGHSRRVDAYVDVLEAHLGLNPSELEALRIAASLHEVGALGIPDLILSKKRNLNKEERIKYESHVEIGARIVSSLTFPNEGELAHEEISISEIILRHHERYDGLGYPGGIKGKEIPKLSRILSCLDLYDELLVMQKRKETDDEKDEQAETAMLEFSMEAGRRLDPVYTRLILQHHRELQSLHTEHSRLASRSSAISGEEPDIANTIARSYRNVELLYEAHRQLTEMDLEMDEVLDILMKNGTEIVPKAALILYLYDSHRGHWQIRAPDLLKWTTPFASRTLGSGSTHVERCIRSRQPLFGPEVVGDLREINPMLAEECRAGYLFPLATKQADLVVGLYFEAGLELSAEQSVLVKALCQWAAPPLRAAQLRSLADTDALTGLATPQRLRREAEKLLNSTIRREAAVITVDISGLRDAAGRFGRDLRDRLLEAFAREVRQHIRPTDMAARAGENELAIIIPRATREAALERIKQIHHVLNQEEFHGATKLPPDLCLSVSTGLAMSPDEGQNIETLLQIAESRMQKGERPAHARWGKPKRGGQLPLAE